MKRPIRYFVLGVILASGAATAHSDVQNEVVKARMDAMSIIGKNTKTLGSMAKGELAFDTVAAKAAVDEIAAQAAQAPSLFQDPQTDPESEAKPNIWENFSDFASKAKALEAAASRADVASLEGLRASLGDIGGTCKACHSDYRLKK